jgi:hypothetical protein
MNNDILYKLNDVSLDDMLLIEILEKSQNEYIEKQQLDNLQLFEFLNINKVVEPYYDEQQQIEIFDAITLVEEFKNNEKKENIKKKFEREHNNFCYNTYCKKDIKTNICCICLDKQSNIKFPRCNHTDVCNICVKFIEDNKCPICRVVFSNIIIL